MKTTQVKVTLYLNKIEPVSSTSSVNVCRFELNLKKESVNYKFLLSSTGMSLTLTEGKDVSVNDLEFLANWLKLENKIKGNVKMTNGGMIRNIATERLREHRKNTQNLFG